MPYVGVPFGTGPGQDTCWSLVARVYREQLGVDLPAYGEVSATDLLRIAKAMDQGQQDGWVPVEAPAAFDVCLMRGPQGRAAVVHVGVMVDAVRVLHVERASAAVVVSVAHFMVAQRIAGYRRRAA